MDSRHLILPAVALGSIPLAIITRITRASVLDVNNEDYVRTARAKGLDERRISSRHIMRNAWLPVVTVLHLPVGGLLAGAVITETVFGWVVSAGMLSTASSNRDYFVIQNTILIFAIIFLMVNLLVDILYAVLDPQIRYASMAAPAIPIGQSVDRRITRSVGRRGSSPITEQARAGRAVLHRPLRDRRGVRADPRPYGPLEGGLAQRLEPPSSAHVMGTDSQGRDEYSRVLYGAQVSLLAGVASVVMGVAIGGTIGALAGGVGGKLDSVLMRFVDVLLAVPGILLAIGIVAFLGRGLPQIMFAVAVVNVPIFARILRGSLLSLRESDYITAARSLGASGSRILLRHLLPNSLSPLIVAATLALATAIIDVAGLGFLGLGPPDPRTPEWGTMLTDSTKFIRQAPWLLLFPGAAIVVSAVGFNLLGDGLRKSLDPRMRR